MVGRVVNRDVARIEAAKLPQLDDVLRAFQRRDYEACLELLSQLSRKQPKLPPAEAMLAVHELCVTGSDAYPAPLSGAGFFSCRGFAPAEIQEQAVFPRPSSVAQAEAQTRSFATALARHRTSPEIHRAGAS